jgi:thymidylate synthase
MNKIQVTQPTFLINLDNPTEVSYVPMDGNWKFIIVQPYPCGFPEIKDDEILYTFTENRGYIKQQQVMISDDFQIGPNGAYEHVGNELDLQYQDLLQHILDNGVEKKDRTGTGTLSVFGHQIRHNMKDGFPLLTTKKMAWKTMVTELIWFLRGDTNIKYLVDNNCHIWDGDAYKNYCMSYKDGHEFYEDETVKRSYTQEEFINKIKTDDEFAKKWGELGPVYGKQWRGWDSYDFIDDEVHTIKIDQIANLISELKTNPDSRRLMVNAWNVGELDQMVLPPCHYSFQVYTRELSIEEKEWELEKTNCINDIENDRIIYGHEWEKYIQDQYEGIQSTQGIKIPTRAISLMWNQRSVDTFLGLPFNIASYGLLLELIAKAVNMVPDELIGNLGDVHLYLNHIEQAKEQISRTPYELPKLIIEHSSLEPVELIHKLENYQSHPTIKAKLSN